MATKIGKFEAGGQQYSLLQINRTLSGLLGAQVSLGQLSSMDGNHNLVISVQDVIGDEVVQYKLFTNNNVPQAVWGSIPPVNEKQTDYTILYRVDGNIVTLRMDRSVEKHGVKEYRVRISNLRPELEHYNNAPEMGVIPQVIPQVVPGHHPIPAPPSMEIRKLERWLEHHVHSAAPHTGHELVIRKNQPNGYVGLDSNGKISAEQLPESGKLIIRIGSQEVMFDGTQDVVLDLTGDKVTVHNLTSGITQNLTADNAASDDDISMLFDGDPVTPELNPNDPGIYVDDQGESGEGSEEEPEENIENPDDVPQP